MDTSEQVAIETSSHTDRRRRTVEEKRRIVEETLEAGASVARVARRKELISKYLLQRLYITSRRT